MIKSNSRELWNKVFAKAGHVFLPVGKKVLRNSRLRKIAFTKAKERLRKMALNRESKRAEDGYYMFIALLHSIEQMLDSNVSPKCFDALTDIFMGKLLGGGEAKPKKIFLEETGRETPFFVLVCPTQLCNLKCPGCYTASGKNGDTLKYEVFDRIVREIKELWGAHFIVLSGGEPLLYPRLFDIAKKHQDVLFLMYSNGTLINEKMAQRLAEAGNITPAISVEGFEKETDARRGEGVYQKILTAFANMRNAGVPFGISVTATSKNIDVITSDEFYDFYFEQQGVKYQWQFHYMPVGRSYTLELMPTPQQRLFTRERKRKMEREKEYFIGDFWNDGPSCRGCLAAGRGGGYFNITGSGDCTPCGFQPYTADNINDIYEKGGNLNTVLKSDFFRAVRKWQDNYAYGKSDLEQDNLLMTCPIRDHYKEFYEHILQKHHPRPIYPEAGAALEDEEYRKGMIDYGKSLKRLSAPIWNKEYLNKNDSSR
ncbi:hypothetical protein B9J78_00485 [bacterium Unc6]|nr:hypothetical protein [bacterium Unc6]